MKHLTIFVLTSSTLLACGGTEPPPAHPPTPAPVTPTVEAVPAPSEPARDAEVPKDEPKK